MSLQLHTGRWVTVPEVEVWVQWEGRDISTPARDLTYWERTEIATIMAKRWAAWGGQKELPPRPVPPHTPGTIP